MPVGKITHGFGGFTKVGSVYTLNQPGGIVTMPRSLQIPYPISYSNHGQQNYADGPRFPVSTFPALPMDSVTPWFTAALLNSWFFTRGAFPELDLTAISGGIIFSDNGILSGTGTGTWRILNPKGAGFALTLDKGGQSPLMQLRFAGTDRDATTGSAPASPLDGTPLQADAVTLGGDLASVGITGLTLIVDTGLVPNWEIDGTNRPVEMNAGLLTGLLIIRMNATSSANAPGWNVDPTLYTPITGTISIKRLAGAGNTVRFTITKGLLQNPDERMQRQGRITREFVYVLIGSSSADPVTVADV